MKERRAFGPREDEPDLWSRLGLAEPWSFDRALNFVFPPKCLRCEGAIREAGSLCGECWEMVTFIDGAICNTCGQPFEIDLGDEVLCGACIAHPPAYDRARAIFVYNEVSRAIVTGFKYGDRTDRVPAFGRWLCRAGRDLLQDADVIVPVPLHFTRLWVRRFNQSALLARAIHRETLVPVLLDGLSRHRRTAQQVGLTNAKRQRNVRGAFEVTPKYKDRFVDKRVLVIDDVVTSGATIEACAKVLRRAGAQTVDVLSLARVAQRP